MFTEKSKLVFLKVLSLFSVIRGYNIPILVLAQYLATIFILAPEKSPLQVFLDWHLFLLVLISSMTIAAGYIINNFYDLEKDLINRPQKLILDTVISQKTTLIVYFSLNIIATLLAFLISIRAVLFFSVFIFLIWFYSHKLKKNLIVGNLTASVLAIFPFFGILLYYKNFHFVIFFHALFLFLLILIREIVKDLENLKGDLANNYHTIPAYFGELTAKKVITALTILTVIPVYFLIEKYDVGYMDIYFYVSFMVLLLFLSKLWRSETHSQYLQLHILLKIMIVSGVLCLVLINPSVF
jgi:4-hydroxybenzoate polyprenyltransferase